MNFTQKDFFNNLTNAAVFLFFSGALFLPSGYSWGAVALLLLALIYLGFNRKEWNMNPKFITYTFLIYFVATLISFLIYNTEKPIQVDLASRFFLAIPVVIFLAKKELNIKNILIGVALGGILAFVIAYYQVYIAQTHTRAQGHIPHIMFGQTSVLWGMLSLVGFLVIDKIKLKHRWLFATLLLLGSLGGTYAAIFSGSKGAWILFPPAIILYFVVAWKKVAPKYLFSIFIMFALVFVWIFTSNNIVKNRSIDAVAETKEFQEEPDKHYGSVGARAQMYKVGTLLFIEHPFLGIGKKAKDAEVAKLDISDELKERMKSYVRLHNDYIDLAAYYGLLVLIPFLILLGVPAWYFGRKLFTSDWRINYFALSGFMVVACDAMSSMTDTYFQSNTGPMTYGFLIPIFGTQLWRILQSKKAKAKTKAKA